MRGFLDRIWYGNSRLYILLLPFSWLFSLAVCLRHYFYAQGWLKSEKLPVTTVIVGNLSVGGTGKTPFVVWLATWLRQEGYNPGIICRGYGGKSPSWPVDVTSQVSVHDVGDEAILFYKRTACPVFAGPDRVAAGAALLMQHPDCDILISDDGLQHYALERDLEILVVDGSRHFGNRQLLPAGPLREPVRRAECVNLVVNTEPEHSTKHRVVISTGKLVNLANGTRQPVKHLAKASVHAIAGIGNPDRFFRTLRQLGLSIIEHPMPDHHDYQASDLVFRDAMPVVMTEKDAVKCQKFAKPYHWYLPVEAQPDADIQTSLRNMLRKYIDR